jgi:hypothetical protein
MSDDTKDDERKIVMTNSEGAILLRALHDPIFVYPSGSFEDHFDVYMQLNFVRYCMKQERYVADFLEWIDQQEIKALTTKKDKGTKKEKKKNPFKVIK